MIKKELVLFWGILVVIIILEIIFVGTKKQVDTNVIEKNNNTYSTEKIEDKISMIIKDGTLTKTKATIIITDNNEQHYLYDEWFRIDKKEDGKWRKAEIINNEYSFIAIGYKPDKNGRIELVVDWENLYGSLEKGEYRIIKNAYDNNGKKIFLLTEFNIDI